MKTEKSITDFIDSKLKIEPNPYLTTQIMAKLESMEHNEPYKLSSLQKAVVAVSITVVVLLGISLGTLYNNETTESFALNINDSQIENLQIFSDPIVNTED